MGEGEEGLTLEYTPTWVIAGVCTVIIAISYAMERLLHRLGNILQSKHKKPLYEALLKVKEELMLLGFMSLLLTVFQSAISKICMSRELQRAMLPCKVEDADEDEVEHIVSGGTRHLLSSGATNAVRYCGTKNKVPLMSIEALHNLHIFIFILAIVHVTFSVLTVTFGGLKTSFLKQFHASVTKADYEALRLGFIMLASMGIRDSLLVAECSWYGISIAAVSCNMLHYVLLRWHLLLAVGTKLEHVITSLAYDVAEKHVAVEGDLVVRPSDELFWFNNPRLVLKLIHFILFQNAFEIAYFFWIWVQFGFRSCLMGELTYIVPRLSLGMSIQVVCSYSTLPLYAIVAQMGSSFNKAIFDDHVQASLLGWAKKVKKKQALKLAAQASPSGRIRTEDDSKADAPAAEGDDSKSDASTPEEYDPEKASGDAK
ncbi:hypothetical protein V6N13_088721 [Hibiscus sabdariffa]|uniref:MLO-like protein n=1 Tax=Hibiscus sabdariffa TaxID=183260 RepID=A0ABR2G0P4_9ROSI